MFIYIENEMKVQHLRFFSSFVLEEHFLDRRDDFLYGLEKELVFLETFFSKSFFENRGNNHTKIKINKKKIRYTKM